MKCLFGRRIYSYDVVGSTNLVAKRLALQGAEEGTVVISETQIRGRGRLGRLWCSPAGGIWLSLILRPKLPPHDTLVLTTLAAVAVVRSIRKLCKIRAQIRWPNDIVVRGRKVCGILAETVITGAQVNFAVIGVGLNANFELRSLPQELRDSTTTLLRELQVRIDRDALIRTLLSETERLYGMLLTKGRSRIVSEAQSLSSTVGRQVEVITQEGCAVGKAVGLARDGSLKLRTSSGVKRMSDTEVVRVIES